MSGTATIEVEYVNPPKEGKKKGSIKTKDGEYYGVWPDKLHLYAPGNTYTIQYESSEFKGKTYKDVKRIVDAPATTAAKHATNGNGSTKSREMFAMGFVNRIYAGTGKIPTQ